jgi:mono/diheme cytochrome c family protein
LNSKLLLITGVAATWMAVVSAQTTPIAAPAASRAAASTRRQSAPQATPAARAAATPGVDATTTRALMDQYCVVCHNARLKTANLLLDQLVLTLLAQHG